MGYATARARAVVPFSWVLQFVNSRLLLCVMGSKMSALVLSLILSSSLHSPLPPPHPTTPQPLPTTPACVSAAAPVAPPRAGGAGGPSTAPAPSAASSSFLDDIFGGGPTTAPVAPPPAPVPAYTAPAHVDVSAACWLCFGPSRGPMPCGLPEAGCSPPCVGNTSRYQVSLLCFIPIVVVVH